jgi:diacylglycerol kinase (ATP)
VRVSLLYNPNAGEGDLPHPLPEMLTRHGHQVVTVVDDKRQAEERLLGQPCDLVVVAGGDGTVGLAARTVAHRGIPMAILPLGTANNIALTLGIEGSIDELIGGWRSGRSRPIDVGQADGPWGSRAFVESLGSGLMAAGIAEAAAAPSEQLTQPLSNLARTAHVYRRALDKLQPRRGVLVVDGERVEDEFLVIEVLNMRFVGPNLVFAQDADPSDGVFSVAVARSDERSALDDYLRHRLEGRDYPLSLRSYTGRRVQLDDPSRLHVDDWLYETDAGVPVSLEIREHAVTVLV